MNTGARSSAQLIFTTPLRVFQFSMSSTKSAGSSTRSICSRNVIFGWMAVTTSGARSSSPVSSTTPVAAPPSTRIFATRGARADLGAVGHARSSRDRVAHRAHAAFRHGPRAEVAVADVADRVVRHDVAGARLVRPGPGADQAVRAPSRSSPDRTRRTDRAGRRPTSSSAGSRRRARARRAHGTAMRAGAAP